MTPRIDPVAWLLLRNLRIYLAAPLCTAARATVFAARLHALGHTVVSTWHAIAPAGDPHATLERAAVAEQCRREVASAELVIALTDQGPPRGTLVEIGIALGLGIPVLWLQGPAGVGANVFDGLATVLHSPEDLFAVLGHHHQENPAA